ncbi:hypothetical protein GCM10028794_10450 [Silanimonas algicola]
MSPRALLLHGAGAWGGQWAVWRRVFDAEGWRVDAPDFTPAPGGLADTRLQDYVDEAARWLETTPATALIGASLGGLVAAAAAARVPEVIRPRALVLVNPMPPAPWADALPSLDAGGAVVPWRSMGRFASTQRALAGAGFADQHLAFRHWRDESAAVLREARAGVAVRSTGIPVLVIASDEDDDVPPMVSEAYARGIGASLCRLPGGHVAPVMGRSAAAAAGVAVAWLASSLSAS